MQKRVVRRAKAFNRSKSQFLRFLKTYHASRSYLRTMGDPSREIFGFKESATGVVENVNKTLDTMATAGQPHLEERWASQMRLGKETMPERKQQIINEIFGYKKTDHTQIRSIRTHVNRKGATSEVSRRAYRYVRTRKEVLKIRLPGDTEDKKIMYSFVHKTMDESPGGYCSAFFFVDMGDDKIRILHFMYIWQRRHNYFLQTSMRDSAICKDPKCRRNINRSWFLYDTQDYQMGATDSSDDFLRTLLDACVAKVSLTDKEDGDKLQDKFMLHFNEDTRDSVQLDAEPKDFDEEAKLWKLCNDKIAWAKRDYIPFPRAEERNWGFEFRSNLMARGPGRAELWSKEEHKESEELEAKRLHQLAMNSDVRKKKINYLAKYVPLRESLIPSCEKNRIVIARAYYFKRYFPEFKKKVAAKKIQAACRLYLAPKQAAANTIQTFYRQRYVVRKAAALKIQDALVLWFWMNNAARTIQINFARRFRAERLRDYAFHLYFNKIL